MATILTNLQHSSLGLFKPAVILFSDMQLTPDSLRQWYVYFQEKEMGPFRESELSQKLATKEIAYSAYVFTEGMTDWALASETPVLTAATVRDTPQPPPKKAEPTSNSNSLSSVLGASLGATSAGGSSFSGTTGPANVHGMGSNSDKTQEKEIEKVDHKSSDHKRDVLSLSQPNATPKTNFSENENEASSVNVSKVRSVSSGVSTVVETKVRKKSEKDLAATKRFGLPKLRLPKLQPISAFWAAPVLLILAIGGGYYYATNGGYIPYVSDLLGVVVPGGTPNTKNSKQNKKQKKLEAAAPVESSAPTPAPSSGSTEAAGSKELNWAELQSFRKVQDPKSPPYRLASGTLGADRPVLVGVLSPLLKGKFVRVAIFPQSDRNLMAIPRLWDFYVSVVDGYFSVGPLTLDGEKLPPGRYNVLIQMGKSFLGDTSFEVGTWPSGAELSARQTQLQKERSALAEKERSAIEAKMREVNAAIGQLKVYGRYAGQGAKGAKDWKKLSKPWKDSFQKALNYQRSVLSGPMFYGKMQNSIFSFMLDIAKVFEALNTESQGGSKEVQKKYKKGLGQFWTDLTKQQGALSGEIQLLSQAAPAILQIDMRVVKAQLGKVKNDQE